MSSNARGLQRRQQYKSRGTRQRMASTRKSVNSIIKRALTAPSTNVGRNAFMKAAYGATSKETGFVDYPGPVAFDTTGDIVLLNEVPQGAGVMSRIGKKIVMKGLQCRGFIANNSAALFNKIAYLIVYDKRPTGALPAISDILISITSQAMNNDANAGRFRILKRVDDILIGNPTQAAAPVGNGNITDSCYKIADFYLDLKGLPVTYKAAGTGAIGDIEEGAVYAITVGHRAASATLAAAADWQFRTRFVDV